MKPLLHKLLFLVILLLAVSYQPAAAQNFSTRFLETVNYDNMSVVTVNASMIDAMKTQTDDKKLLAFFDELDFVRVITVTKDALIHYGVSLAMLKNSEDFNSLVSSQDGINLLHIMALPAAQGRAKEIVLVSYDIKTLTIVNITGNINIRSLGDLSAALRKSFQ